MSHAQPTNQNVALEINLTADDAFLSYQFCICHVGDLMMGWKRSPYNACTQSMLRKYTRCWSRAAVEWIKCSRSKSIVEVFKKWQQYRIKSTTKGVLTEISKGWHQQLNVRKNWNSIRDYFATPKCRHYTTRAGWGLNSNQSKSAKLTNS